MPERVEFAFGTTRAITDGTHAVYPMSLLFRAGEYDDKQYAMTPDEIHAAVAAFSPTSGNIEHTKFLQGRACEVRKVWADGDLLRGEVAVPLGLDALLTNDERKLSCEWDRETKTLSGMALCMNPRVHDAALMSLDTNATALFASKGDMSTGIQALHDMALGAGAQCTPDAGGYPSSMQTFHDMAKQYGASCHANMSTAPKAGVGQGATGDPATMSKEMQVATEQEQALGLWQAIKTFFAPTQESAATATFAATGETATEKALRTQVETMQAERIAERAVQFADAEVAAKRAVPAERATMIALFAQAARDDAALSATVTFSTAAGEQSGGRVDALTALYASRPAHILTDELVKLTEAQVTALTAQFSGGTTKETVNAEEKATLMGMTALGVHVTKAAAAK